MSFAPRHEWPMPEYLKAWKLFRDNSDENEVTSRFLVERPSWPRKGSVSICDLGCGDGRMIAGLLSRGRNIYKVRLVDPDNDLLAEAEALVEQRFPETHIIAYHNSVREGWPMCAGDSDITLAVHLVYLLEEDELLSLLHNRPKNTLIYIVLDAPSSVFTELWGWTADKYYRRAQFAHATICKFLGLSAPPPDSILRSRISKRCLAEHELSDWLLSILCYRNMFTDVPTELRLKVREIINRHTDKTGEFVECESVCYELPPQV